MRTRHYEYIDELVVRAKNGDDNALLLIIDFYQPLLKTSIKYCVSRYPVAACYTEDIEADLYLIMRELVRQYDAELSFFSYFLSTRIDFVLQTHVRKSYLDSSVGGRRPKEIFIEDMPEDWEPFVDQDPVGKIIASADLSSALLKLEDKYRTAVQLYFFEGMNQQQAADYLSITQSSFSKRLNKAIEQLRDFMSDFEKTLITKE